MINFYNNTIAKDTARLLKEYVFLQINNISLEKLLNHSKKKFIDINYDKYHIYKSLIYFIGADKEPMPVMLEDISWRKVKSFFQIEIKRLSKLD